MDNESEVPGQSLWLRTNKVNNMECKGLMRIETRGY